VDSARVFQDNMSTISLMQRGASNSEKSRHIGIRFFWMKDRIAGGEISVEHMPTISMLADILTKPLQGELFRVLRKRLLNWDD